MKRCLGCMNEYGDEFSVCPHCGYVEGTEPDEAIHMMPGTVLNNRFILGKVVGFGGFGVTYIAWDLVLQHRVAIKEYLPSEFSTRIPGQTHITIYEGEKHEQYKSGMERFVDEAKKLAKFNDEQGIVRIYDSFTENETAYIVMEYLEGETLDKILKRENKIEPEQAVKMIMPIMESLKRVHKEGVIHRDIAPDNVMVTVNGEMKLIDFGAARYATTSHSRSLTVIIKPGYSPEEQYRSRGDQGPHTDVYALCAMLYKMITGITPPDAFERRANFESKKKDILEPIKKYCKDIPENVHSAILNGMNVRVEDRSKDMSVLINELTSKEPVKRINGKIKKIDVLKWPLWAKIAVPLAMCSVVMLGILFAMGIIGFKSDLQNDIVIPDGMTRVPAIINTYLEQSEEVLQKAKLMYTFEDKTESEVIPKDYVLWQSVNPGQIAQVNSEIRIIVSAGPTLVKVELVEGLNKEDAVKLLEEAGFVVTCLEEYDSTTAEGAVISQSIEGEQYISKGSSIQLLVSKGKNPADNVVDKIINVPDFVGKTYEEARGVAAEYGISVEVFERKYSSEYEVNVVMAQNIKPGTEMSNTEVIQLVISLGVKQVRVPDVVLETEEEAKVLFDENELKYVVRETYDDNVKVGLVISQSIAEGEMVAPGTSVEIVISKGRESFNMPSVVEMNEAEAKDLLVNKGLAVTITYANSDKVASGNVISQSIDMNTKVTPGTAVSIVVSSGEKLYELPEIVGKNEKSAVKALEDLSFKVQVTKVYDEDVAEGIVVSQSIKAGTQHKKGTDIIISVSKGKQPLKITFDANGGNCDKNLMTLYLGDVYGNMPTPTRQYFTFDGWYTAKSGGKKVDSSTVVKTKSNQTLYAQWKQNVVSITYDMGDGTVYHQSGAFQGNKYQHPKTPTKAYYTFMGWYTQKTGGNRIDEDTLITATGSQRLYAQWQRNTLSVIFNANGGNSNSNRSFNQGDKYILPTNPTRNGYIFNGWYTETSGGSKVTSETKVEKSGSQTLYAQWMPIKYTINYNGNGATGGNTENSSHTYDIAGALANNGYTKKGYTFQGWATTNTATTVAYTNGQSVKNLSNTNGGTITLYAVWKANTYTVVYKGNGATSGGTGEHIFAYDESKMLLCGGYKRDYYTFVGWCTTSDGTGKSYLKGEKVSNLTDIDGGVVTLYAQWKLNDLHWGNADSVPSGASIVKYKYTKITRTVNNSGVCPNGYVLVSKTYSGNDKLVSSGSYTYLDPDEYNKYSKYIDDIHNGERPVCGEDEYLVSKEYKLEGNGDNYAHIYHFCSATSGTIGAWSYGEYDMYCCHAVRNWTLLNPFEAKDDVDGITRWLIYNVNDSCPRGNKLWFVIPIWQCDWTKYVKIYNYKYEKEETITSNTKLSSTEEVTYELLQVQYRPK